MNPVSDPKETPAELIDSDETLSGSGVTPSGPLRDSGETSDELADAKVLLRFVGDHSVPSANVAEDATTSLASPAEDYDGTAHRTPARWWSPCFWTLTCPAVLGFFNLRRNRRELVLPSIGRWAPSHIEPAYSSESARASRGRDGAGRHSLPRAAAPGGPRTTGAKRKLSYGVKTIFCPASPSGPELSGRSGEAVGDSGQKIVSARRVWGCEAVGVPTHIVTVVRTSSVHGSSSIEE